MLKRSCIYFRVAAPWVTHVGNLETGLLQKAGDPSSLPLPLLVNYMKDTHTHVYVYLHMYIYINTCYMFHVYVNYIKKQLFLFYCSMFKNYLQFRDDCIFKKKYLNFSKEALR